MKLRKVFLAGVGLLALAGPVLAADTASIRTTPFPDVPRNHWAFSAVEELRERGILRGYPPDRFTPPTEKATEQQSTSQMWVAPAHAPHSVSRRTGNRSTKRHTPSAMIRRARRQP